MRIFKPKPLYQHYYPDPYSYCNQFDDAARSLDWTLRTDRRRAGVAARFQTQLDDAENMAARCRRKDGRLRPFLKETHIPVLRIAVAGTKTIEEMSDQQVDQRAKKLAKIRGADSAVLLERAILLAQQATRENPPPADRDLADQSAFLLFVALQESSPELRRVIAGFAVRNPILQELAGRPEGARLPIDFETAPEPLTAIKPVRPRAEDRDARRASAPSRDGGRRRPARHVGL